MNFVSSSQHSGTRMRQQLILIVAAFLLVLTITVTRSGNKVDKSVSGFDQVNKADEEDFENSRTGGINTIPLSEQPADIFGDTPTYDPKKPDLIVHVGPLKTGSNDMMQEIKRYTKNLKTDQYTVLDALDGFHEACQHELSLIREKYSLMSEKKLKKAKPLAMMIKELPCWKSVLNAIEPFKASYVTPTLGNETSIGLKKKAVIICDEQLAKQLLPDVYQIGPAAMEWTTIRDTIMNDFNFVIIVSYLRYYEWLPSAKAATEQYHIVQHTSSVPRLARWPGEREHGMLLEPLFPHFVNNAMQKIDIPYTGRIIDMYRPYVSKIKILNLHVPDQSIATTFVCDVLESATTTCTASQKDDYIKIDNDPSVLKNPIALIMNTTEDTKWYDFQLYDELATTAMKRGLVRSRRVTRTIATSTTQYYVEQYLKIQPRTALPLSCPNSEQLRHFLDESLAYERTLLGSDFASAIKQHHKDEYQRMVDKNMFCSINMRAVLRQVNWRNFFRHLSNQSAQRIQAGGKPFPTRKAILR
jgi:hypothetical protein